MKVEIKQLDKMSRWLRAALNKERAEFITDAEYDNEHDYIYSLPTIGVVKEQLYTQWVVLRIDNGTIYLGGVYENYGEKCIISVEQLSIDEMLEIANELI